MKNVKYIGLVLMLAWATSSYAQADESVYRKYLRKSKYEEGYVLLKDSTRVYGALAYPKWLLQTMNMVTNSGERKTYTFSQIRAYQRGDNYYETDGSLFYRLVKRGNRVSLYERVVTSTTMGANGMMMSHSNVYHYFRKTGSMQFETISKLNFARDMARFFIDCTELSLKLADRNYSYDSKSSLVDAYDRCN